MDWMGCDRRGVWDEPRFWSEPLEGWSCGFLRQRKLSKEGLVGGMQPSLSHAKFEKPKESPKDGKDTDRHPHPDRS